MAKIYRLNRNFEDTVEQKKTQEQSDVFTEFMIVSKKQSINKKMLQNYELLQLKK